MAADQTYSQAGQGIYRKQGDLEMHIGSASTFVLDTGSTLLLESQAGLTALAGGGQMGATPITSSLAQITTVATTGDSVGLPASQAGLMICVANAGANSCNIFPATGDAINGGAANAAYALAAGHNVVLHCPVAGHWYANSGT